MTVQLGVLRYTAAEPESSERSLSEAPTYRNTKDRAVCFLRNNTQP